MSEAETWRLQLVGFRTIPSDYFVAEWQRQLPHYALQQK